MPSEEMVQRQADQYATILHTTQDGYWLVDHRGRFLEVNEVACQMSGYTRDEMLELSISDIDATESPADTANRMREVIEQGYHLFESLHRAKDGRLYPVEVSTSYWERENCFIVLVRDIGRRKEAADALRESEERFRLLFESAGPGVGYWAPDGTVLAFNRAAAENMGGRPEDFVGKTMVEMFGEELGEIYAGRLHRALDSDSPLAYEDRLQMPGGVRWFISHYTRHVSSEGVVLGVQIVSTDITKQRHAQRALEQSEERYRVVVENAAEAILVADEGRIVFTNPSCTRISGWSAEELQSKPFTDFIHSDDRALVMERHVRQMQGLEVSPQHVIRILRPEGDPRWVELNVAPIKWEGRPATLTFIEDITERKGAEEEREITIRLLQILNRTNNLHGLIREVTNLMQEWSGCEAVGVRLGEGDDFPYFETRGFPPEFVEAERYQCAVDSDGELLRDSAGNPTLECMCGNVIRGRTDPGLPFFTEGGSFWTNSTTDLLASTTEEDRQARTRNRCHGEGYESVALIPLRHGDNTLGLLQFNDLRRDRFTPALIGILERMAGSLAIALYQRKDAQALRISETLLRSTQRLSQVGGWEYDVASGALSWTKETYRIHDLTPGALDATMSALGELSASCYEGDASQTLLELFWRCVEEGVPYDLESRFTSTAGRRLWVRTAGYPVRDNEERIVKAIGHIMDITEQKQAEEELRASEALFRAAASNFPSSYLSIIEKDFTVGFTAGRAFAELGMDPEDFVGMQLEQVFGDLAPTVRAHYRATFAGQEQTFELFINEQHQVYRTVPLFGKDGGVDRILAVVEDVTERKQTEARIMEQLSELRRWQRVMMERETRILDLKREVNDLLSTVGQSPRYRSVESAGEDGGAL